MQGGSGKIYPGAMISPGKAPGINPEKSDTDLKPSTSSADENRLERDLRAHFRKLGQFREGRIPLDVHPSQLTAHHFFYLPGNLESQHFPRFGNPA